MRRAERAGEDARRGGDSSWGTHPLELGPPCHGDEVTVHEFRCLAAAGQQQQQQESHGAQAHTQRLWGRHRGALQIDQGAARTAK